MTYLDKIAEMSHEYKVLTYTDHRADRHVSYFNDYEEALKYYKSQLLQINIDAKFTAGVAIIRTKTGEPVVRQTWRV